VVSVLPAALELGAQSAATWSIDDGALRLSIPVDQGLWCADLHDGPLRVSCIQSGSFCGPLGSTIGQQPFRDGLVVAEEQPAMKGYTPHFATVEARLRAVVTSRSMVAVWMVGMEDQPNRSGEICVAEIFGEGVAEGSAEIGMGVKAFRDPALVEEFSADRFDVDVTEFHTYGVQWESGGLRFTIDGQIVRRLDQSPDYPMQLMIGVFDFPVKGTAVGQDSTVPELIVDHVRGHAPTG
jgi:hypothetical protein